MPRRPKPAPLARPPTTEGRRELLVFLAVAAFSYLSITRGLHGTNPWSRMALTASVVERGTLDIDPYVPTKITMDWSRSGDHYYSNKAPGPALLAVPVYFVQYHLERALGVDPHTKPAHDAAGYLANLVTSIVPSLLALALFWTMLVRRFKVSTWTAYLLSATWAVSSLALPYSIMWFGHQSAGAFFTIGLCLAVLELDREGGPRPRWLYLSGLAMGMAVLSEYLAAMMVAVWAVWLMWRVKLDRKALLPWALGGAGPALLVMAYHTACFGSPFTLPYDAALVNPVFADQLGLELPSLTRLADITIRPWRGVLYCNPAFLLVLLGVERFRADAKANPELWAALASVVLVVLFLAGFPSSYGGYCVGPRYITSALPLATLLLLPATRIAPRLLVALAAVGALMMFAASLSDPIPPDSYRDPFREYLFPLIGQNAPTRMYNFFTGALGFTLSGALVGYLAVWAATTAWMWSRLGAEHAALRGATAQDLAR